jgi:hypothetical protein
MLWQLSSSWMVRFERRSQMEEEGPFCIVCGRPAVWVRFTQFSGNHGFCARHAEEQEDFGKDDPSYFFWAKREEVECEKDQLLTLRCPVSLAARLRRLAYERSQGESTVTQNDLLIEAIERYLSAEGV